jgi:hypothetical protein
MAEAEGYKEIKVLCFVMRINATQMGRFEIRKRG